MNFWKLNVATHRQVSHRVPNDTTLARQVTPHVVLVLFLRVEIHKLLNLHDWLPSTCQMSVRRFNLLTTLSLVPLHLLGIRLVQQVQQKPLVRAGVILLIGGVHSLASEQRRIHITSHRGDCRAVDSFK